VEPPGPEAAAPLADAPSALLLPDAPEDAEPEEALPPLPPSVA
jgi:hypothetical protein